MQVKKTTHETVLPAAPSPGGSLQLTNIDQVMPRVYISLLLFFNQEPLQDASALLKASLAETLTLFYPCAGRYAERSDGGLKVVCNDEGAVFFETWVDGRFDDFLPNFEPHPDFALLVPELNASASISRIPLLFAQITHFECGGICLGIHLHHNVCDGVSTVHFLSSWATLAKSKATRDVHGEDAQCSLRPHINHSLLKANEPPCPTSDHPEYQTHMPNLPTSWPPSTSKIFPFTPASIDALRARASPDNTPSHSRFEALAAYLWRGVTHARGLAPDQETRLGMAVDGRRRFKPPLPEGYFGNVNFSAYTLCQAGDLVENPLPFAADLVKTAIATVSDTQMQSALDWVAKQESPKSVVTSFWTPFVDLAITSWWRFPLYDLNFGWGKPAYVRIPASAFDGLIILLPSPMGAGHVDALVGLQVEHMSKFEEYIACV